VKGKWPELFYFAISNSLSDVITINAPVVYMHGSGCNDFDFDFLGLGLNLILARHK
jgi:hypothetical protein